MDDKRIRIRFMEGEEIFLFTTTSTPTLELILSTDTGESFLGGKEVEG
jgi:hypothetical protein